MKHFLSITDINAQEVLALLEEALFLKQELRTEGANQPVLAGKSLAMIFEKPSLRTRVSFEIGMTQLGGHAVNLAPAEIGLGTREPTSDVGQVLSGMADIIMARTFAHQTVLDLAASSSVPVINGLSDREHPCQILADLLTILEAKGKLRGLAVAYVGDGENNVTHSWALAAAMLGMRFRVGAPAGYQMLSTVVTHAQELAKATGAQIEQMADPLAAVTGADVVMTDTWVSMGDEAEKAARLATFGSYRVTSQLMARAAADAIFLHCLPAYRDNEVEPAVIDGPRSRVFDQAANRLYVQKVLLLFLLGVDYPEQYQLGKKEPMSQPFYDPTKTYGDNYDYGPFGALADERRLERTGPPKYTFLGQPVYQPFGIPAGPLVNSNFVKAAFAKGFDIATYKTIRSSSYPVHPWPNVLGVRVDGDLTLDKAHGELVATTEYNQPLSITNSFGVPSKDPAEWQRDMAAAAQAAGPGQVLVGSFQGTKTASSSVEDFIEDFVRTAQLVKETGTKILEVNLSCPNEGTAHLLCFDTTRSEVIVAKIKEAIGETPLIIKIAYFEDQDHLREFVRRVGKLVDGISAINTIPAAIVNERGEQALPGEGRLRSGVCGAAIKWAGLEMVRRLKELRTELSHDYAIIGVGGVTKPEDYQEYRNAGADAVMSATGAMWHTELAEQIWQNFSQDVSTDLKFQVPNIAARLLVEIGAASFRIDNPATFKSGIKAPLYIDNRQFLSHPEAWKKIINGFIELIDKHNIGFDIIAGIETAGIPHSSVLGYVLGKPTVFVRKQIKDHGTRIPIEGGDVGGKKVLLIEDLITLGTSSLYGVSVLRAAGATVTDCLAITCYELPETAQNFLEAGVTYRYLTTALAVFEELLQYQEHKLLRDWFDDPRGWAAKHGFA